MSGINGITYVSVNDIVPRIHACSRYFIAPLLNVCPSFRSILWLSSCGMKRLPTLFTASASCGPNWSAIGCAKPLCQKRPRSAEQLRRRKTSEQTTEGSNSVTASTVVTRQAGTLLCHFGRFTLNFPTIVMVALCNRADHYIFAM